MFKDSRHPYTKWLMNSLMDIRAPRRIPTGITGKPPDLMNPPSGCRFWPRCPHTQSVCKEEEPLLIEVAPKHYAACHMLGIVNDGK